MIRSKLGADWMKEGESERIEWIELTLKKPAHLKYPSNNGVIGHGVTVVEMNAFECIKW